MAKNTKNSWSLNQIIFALVLFVSLMTGTTFFILLPLLRRDRANTFTAVAPQDIVALRTTGHRILQEVVPVLPPVYVDPVIGRRDANSGKPMLAAKHDCKEKRIDALRQIAAKNIKCSNVNIDKMLQEFFKEQKYSAGFFDRDEIKKARYYFHALMNGLHAAHYALLNEGARCGEMASVVTLKLVEHAYRSKKCIDIQLRALAVLNDIHGYILFSYNPIPKLTKSLKDFSQLERQEIFILDTFRDFFASVEEILSNPKKFPFFQNEELPQYGSAHNQCIESYVEQLNIQYPGFKGLFEKKLQDIIKVFRASWRSKGESLLPAEYMCDNPSMLYSQVPRC